MWVIPAAFKEEEGTHIFRISWRSDYHLIVKAINAEIFIAIKDSLWCTPIPSIGIIPQKPKEAQLSQEISQHQVRKKQSAISTLTPCTSTCTCIAPPPNHRHTETSNIHICRVCHDTRGNHNHKLPTNPFQLVECSFLPFLVCCSRCLLNHSTALSLGHN